jgi:hypothetical protein
VNEWSGVFLGIIALAVSVMAVVQVGVVVLGARLAKRVEQIAQQVDREIKPLLVNLNVVGQEAARAAELAALQVERVDALFADIAGRVEETAASLQSAIIAPAREGMALVQGIKAAFAALREIRGVSAPAGAAVHDEDDPLFIG